MVDVSVAVRTVPGALPSPSPSLQPNAQKKKRRSKPRTAHTPGEGSVNNPDATDPALAEQAPEEPNVKDGTVAQELAAPSEAPTFDDSTIKSSPVVDTLQKRLKALNKKISRITSYASTDYEKLNDDQKRTLKSLPSLEAVQKELEDIKKLVESHEADLACETAARRADADAAEAARISEAVAASQASSASRTCALLSLIRLHTCLSNRQPLPVVLDFNETEGETIFSLCSALINEESDVKQAAVSGLLSEQGSFNGVPYSRLMDVAQSFLNPPREPTPLPADPDTATEVTSEPASNSQTESQPLSAIPTAGGSLSGTGSFHFMQESELESTAEWVKKSEIELTQNGAPDHPDHAPSAIDGDGTPAESFDWTEANEELPPIAKLQACFATSGSITPVVETSSAPVNGVTPVAVQQPENDRFMHPRDRGRGRGHRGEGGQFRQPRRSSMPVVGSSSAGPVNGVAAPPAQQSENDRLGQPRGRGRGRGYRGDGRGGRGGFRGHRGGDRGTFHGGEMGSATGGRGRGREGRGGSYEGRGAPP